jgi:hypothetical protein
MMKALSQLADYQRAASIAAMGETPYAASERTASR